MSLGVSDRDDRPLIVLDLEHRSTVADVIREEAARHNWRLVNARMFHKVIPRGMSPAGAIGHHGLKDDFTTMLIDMGVPFVRLGHFPSHYGNNIPSVFTAFQDTGHLGARFFAERGFRHLAYVGNVPWGDGEMVYESYADTARSLGCECHLFRMPSLEVSSDVPDRESWLQKQSRLLIHWLKSIPGPVGLLGYTDVMAAKLCLFCIEGGLRVPEDVAILGIGNDSFFCETAPVALSSIDLSWDVIGREACTMLHSLMGGEPPNAIKFLR